MRDEHVVGEHVLQTSDEAALGEVDLLPVAGSEHDVELPHEIECLATDVEAVTDRDGQAGAQTQGRASDTRSGDVERDASGRRACGVLRTGTDTIVPWLVSGVAVAIEESLRAASRRPSSQPSATTTSELTMITSAGAAAAKAALTLPTNPRFSVPRIHVTSWASTPSASSPRRNAWLAGSGVWSSAIRMRTLPGVWASRLRTHRTKCSCPP